MSRTMKRRSVWAVALAMFALFAIPDGMAQRGRSSSRSRSTPRRTQRAQKPRSKPKAQQQKSSWGKKSTKASSSKGSKADKALYEKAKRSGTAYKTRGAATQAFKTKHAKQYGSKYTSKPGTRPSHIPQTYASGGTTYNISYNQGYGGYGYMGPLGAWMMYDAMADAAVMGRLMRNQGYYYGAAPRYGPGAGMISLMVVGGIVVLVVGGVVIAKRLG